MGHVVAAGLVTQDNIDMVLSQASFHLKRLFVPRKPLGRSLQLRLDAAKLYSLIHTSKHLLLPPNVTPPEPCEDEDAIAMEIGVNYLPSIQHQAGVIKYHLLSSTRRILQATYDSLTSTSPNQVLRNMFSFIPVIAPSTIELAGRGLFVDGTVHPGTVVALYPGMSYLPSQLRVAMRSTPSEEERSETKDVHSTNEPNLSDYAIARYDGVVIDGAAEISIDLDDILSTTSFNEEQPLSLHHPFANAHLVNHPPPDVSANVLQFILDIDFASLGFPLAALMPVRSSNVQVGRMESFENSASRQCVQGVEHFVSSATWDRTLRTVALVALRPLRDEEIFMNYRFNPKIEPPKWYATCGDGSEASRRWFPRRAFSLS